MLTGRIKKNHSVTSVRIRSYSVPGAKPIAPNLKPLVPVSSEVVVASPHPTVTLGSCARMLRSLLRMVPCRFRGSVLGLTRSRPQSDAAADALLREMHFLLSAQQHLKILNKKYFPTSGMSEQEVIAATAARVGFRMPKAPAADGEGSGR